MTRARHSSCILGLASAGFGLLLAGSLAACGGGPSFPDWARVCGRHCAGAPVQLELGNFQTCLRYAGGAMVCWGDVRGSIEDVDHDGRESLFSSPIHRTDPRRATMLVPDMLDVKDMACADASCCSLRADDSVWCWGVDGFDTLKPGIVNPRANEHVPEPVPGLEHVRHFIRSDLVDVLTQGERVMRVGPRAVFDFGWNENLPTPPEQFTGNSGCALSDGHVYCPGVFNNDLGQRGIGHLGYVDGDNSMQPVVGIDDAIAVAGRGLRCALRASGEVWCWGGDPTEPHATPIRLQGLDHIVDIQFANWHYCALRDDHQLFCWGRDAYSGGTLHTEGHDGERTEPYAVPDATDVVSMAVRGAGICVIRVSGEVACNDGFPPEVTEPEGWEHGDLVTIPNLPDLPADFADEPTLVPEEPFDFDASSRPPPEPNIIGP